MSADTFVDTNVLVYVRDASEPRKQKQAEAWMHFLWQTGTGRLSFQVLQEFYVTVTQKVANPLPSEVAAQIIADLAAWELHCPNIEDVLDAIGLQHRVHTSFWDAMILASALHLGCQILWSEDLTPGQLYGQIEVHNPF